MREARIERVGVFPFSPEEGTPAEKMTDRVDAEEAQRRAELIMDFQQGIMEDFYASRIGKTLPVLCTDIDGAYRVGRSEADSPEIDGVVYFEGEALPGEIVPVHITDLMDGELSGEQVKE